MVLGSGATRRVELATGVDATDGYDRLDIAMPPAPPIRGYSELFVQGDGAVSRLMRSAQTADRSGTEWVVSARVEDDNAVLRWDEPTTPSHWRMTLDGGGESVDMREQFSMRMGRGKHQYRVTLSWIAPQTTRLLPNYPNPFNPETWIPFELSEASEVAIRVYDSRGMLVRRIDVGYREEGYYTRRADAAYWDGRNNAGERAASGVYFYELRAGAQQSLRRMVIHK
ncbi:MAG TPA: T9SS type A sorting domain-containing protein [Gemmatimonadetes bacterium]|nr:T9SS type A sorting domain-containing protein [Gemmatimonadota bacterium]